MITILHENTSTIVNVRLANGDMCRIKQSNLLGYCHCKLHKGYVNLSVLKEHECVKKGCFYLEKFNNRTFWKQREDLKKAKVENKKLAKARKVIAAKIDNELKRLADDAQTIADDMNYTIIITRVAYKTTSNRDDYIINYVSNNRYDDYYEYLDITSRLRNYYGGHYTLKHLKHPDGRYATINDWIHRNKWKGL